MILYSAYFVLLSMFVLNIGAYFDFAFTVIGVGVGMRTVAIQFATLIVVGLVITNRRANMVVWREILVVVAVWTPFLLYMALRVDSDNPYAVLKYLKIVTIAFLCVVTVTATYLCDARTFLRLLPIVIIALSVLLGVEAVMNPEQFRYRSVIERLTVEGMNPIWLARSFALAGVCLFLLPGNHHAAKFVGLALVAAGILPTGSRGPLISLIMTLALWFMIKSHLSKGGMFLTAGATAIVIVSIMLFAGDRIETAVGSYLSRGQSQGFVEESGRPQLFNLAMTEFLSSPVIGVGLGEYGKDAGFVGKAFAGRSPTQGFYPHNIILETLSELGVVGLLLMIITMRPGRWLLDWKNQYVYLFLITLLFSMSSGDINANIGVIVFGALARLTSQYPLDEQSISTEMPHMDPIT
jgi:hypothetical protein